MYFSPENTINGFVLGPIMYFSSAENAINGFVTDQQHISLLKMTKNAFGLGPTMYFLLLKIHKMDL